MVQDLVLHERFAVHLHAQLVRVLRLARCSEMVDWRVDRRLAKPGHVDERGRGCVQRSQPVMARMATPAWSRAAQCLNLCLLRRKSSNLGCEVEVGGLCLCLCCAALFGQRQRTVDLCLLVA
eukprot:CAMPEP_0179874910 /NCGR_PEP_ID=MMETSP0982-20121206/23180_1 /TAXON_ID=483367 /ORGANISM="non described non described, Strain CCMP 2436" /LENGTH=121 /DNA_ID=CAMNT_0021766817 /DNA_START=334 /DNA_END=699 /DNA_ORIENTATION=+